MADESVEDCINGLLEKPLSLRVVVQVVCALSLVGSSIIIFSYLCYKSHRTRARYILVHLSLSNIGQVVSNFVGVTVNFDSTFNRTSEFSYDVLRGHNRSSVEQLCTTQAFLTVYFSLCGMLWTVCLAVYLYLVILGTKQSDFARYAGYVLCYTLPLLVTVWLLLSQRLGYAPYSTPGYCGLVTRKPFQGHRYAKCDPERDVLGGFLGYDIWVVLTILLTVLFYITALCYLRQQVSMTMSLTMYTLHACMKSCDGFAAVSDVLEGECPAWWVYFAIYNTLAVHIWAEVYKLISKQCMCDWPYSVLWELCWNC